jgi:transposase-like protein
MGTVTSLSKRWVWMRVRTRPHRDSILYAGEGQSLTPNQASDQFKRSTLTNIILHQSRVWVMVAVASVESLKHDERVVTHHDELHREHITTRKNESETASKEWTDDNRLNGWVDEWMGRSTEISLWIPRTDGFSGTASLAP